MARSALAPRLDRLLRQAVRPEEDDRHKRSIDDILHGLDKLNAARAVYAVADQFYYGDVGMVWASAKVRLLLDQQGVGEIEDFNYAAIPVDAIAERLQITSVVAAPADENEGGEKAVETASTTAANKAIAALRKRNELDAEEKRLHKDVSRHGECYLFVWPVADESGAITDVDIRVNSAHNVMIIYDEEDQLKPKYAIKSWAVTVDRKESVRVNLYYPDRIERWSTEPGGNAEKEDSWRKLTDVEDVEEEDEQRDLAADEFSDSDDEGKLELGDIPNPWGRVPFFHFRNDRPHGTPEHKNAYGPQQMINKLVYAHAGTIDYQSFPQRYLLMDPSIDDPMLNLSDPDHPDDEDEDVENTSGNAGLSAAPNELWKLWGKSVGQFNAADPQSFMGPLAVYKDAMADLTALPRYAFNRSGDMPSGEAAREMNGDLNAKVQDRRDRYDPTWQDAYEFALKMLGITGISVDVRWAPLVQVNDVAGWQVVAAKITAGVPPKVALEETGYPAEQVDEWLKDATGADLGRRVALLNQIATATQLLGASIVTGAVSAPQVQALIAGLFGEMLAGSDINLPKAKDFVDPQAQLKAQQELAKSQQEHQAGMQQTQLDHASTTQQTSQQFQAEQAEAAHKRAQEMFGAGGAGDVSRQPNNDRRGRSPRGGR